jgi:hypothetical protein
VAVNSDLVLAGIGGGGTSGAELAWFAPLGTAAPTDATTSLNAAFKSAGIVSEEGLSKELSNSSNDIRGYGFSAPIRKIVTEETVTFSVTFMETNTTSLSIYHRLPLTGVGALTVATGGVFSVTEGTFRSQRYSFVGDVVDGVNSIRIYAPSVEVTEKDSFTVQAGEAIQYGVTLTAYPNSSGVSVQTFYKLPSIPASA